MSESAGLRRPEPAGRIRPAPGSVRRLYREEREAWRRHYRRYFKHAARALGLGFVAGFLYFLLWPAQERKALELVVNALKDIPLDGSPLVLALTLFYHNARASVVADRGRDRPLPLPAHPRSARQRRRPGPPRLGLQASGPRRPAAHPDPDPAARRLRAHRRLLRDEPRACTSRPGWAGRPRPHGRRGRARKAGGHAPDVTTAPAASPELPAACPERRPGPRAWPGTSSARSPWSSCRSSSSPRSSRDSSHRA